MAAVAIQNEHGIPNRQPARPFMKNALTKMRKPLRNALGRRLNGEDLTLSERDAERIGMIMQSEIQKSIDSGPWKANSPMTIARKGSSKPLIDTGFMRQSVTFKVTKG